MKEKKFPSAFLDRIDHILPQEERQSFLDACTAPLPKSLRISTKHTNTIAKDWGLEPVPGMTDIYTIGDGAKVKSRIGRTLEHFTGQIYLASLSSFLSVVTLDPQPGEKVLDLCAAPGSKATFISDRIGDDGLLIANEISGSRSKKLVSNLTRMGCENVMLLQSDGTILSHYYGQEFDAILLDAPCSSEGYGRKESDFFEKTWSPRAIEMCSRIQRKLIFSAFEMLALGGTMLYSTCTSAPEENEAIVQSLIDKFGDSVEILPLGLKDIPVQSGIKEWKGQSFSPEVYENVGRIFPHKQKGNFDSELFFLAKIQKVAPLSLNPPEKPFIKHPPSVLPKKHAAEIFARITKTYGLDRGTFGKKKLVDLSGDLYLTNTLAAATIKKNLFRRVGLPFLDKDGNITDEFAFHYGRYATQNVYVLSPEEKDRWLEGYDLILKDIPEHTTKNILVKYENHCLGWGKLMLDKKKLKNKLSRSTVLPPARS